MDEIVMKLSVQDKMTLQHFLSFFFLFVCLFLFCFVLFCLFVYFILFYE